MNLVSVIVDSREPAWVQQLAFGGAAVTTAPLDAGDLLAVCDDDQVIVVERKTASDLLNSIRDERLWPQLAALREVSPWSYLVICGELRPGRAGLTVADGRETGWNWASVSGALLTVQEIGVHVVQIASDYDYEAAVLRLASRERTPLTVRPARDVLTVTETEAILMSLPGIGRDRAKALLDFCGDVASALICLTWDDPACPTPEGIGPETKRRVRRALGLAEGWVMCVTPQRLLQAQPAEQGNLLAAGVQG